MREDFMKCIYKSIAEKLNRDELNDYFRFGHTAEDRGTQMTPNVKNSLQFGRKKQKYQNSTKKQS